MRAARPALLAAGLLMLATALPAARADDPPLKDDINTVRNFAKDPFEQDKRIAAMKRVAKAGTPEALDLLLTLVVDPFEHVRDHAVSALIAALKAEQGEKVEATLAKAWLAHKDPRVRAAAATALGVAGLDRVTKPFEEAVVREEHPLVIVALARAAMEGRDGTVASTAFLQHVMHKDGEAALAACEAGATCGVQAEVPLRRALQHPSPLARAGAVLGLQKVGKLNEADLARVWSDKAPEPRMALADTLELRTPILPWPGEGERALTNLLVDPSWRVRAAAIDAAVKLWDPKVVPLLIERVGAEGGRLHDDAHEALRTITGEDLADDADIWRAWWQQKQGEVQLGERPAPDRHGRIRRTGAHVKVDKGQAVESRTAAFFNLPLRSDRMLFVFDLSGSMGKAARRDSSGGSGGEKPETKMDITRREFAKTLEALPESSLVDLLVYRYPSGFPPRPEVTRALGKLQPCNAPTRRKLVEWLGQAEARGWGAFYEALLAASQDDVDTIVLLSDGVPSRGAYDRPFRLLEEWRRANRFRRVAIHTVLVGSSGTDREFMEDLAWSTWGRSTLASVPR
ncbi:MAG: hypothetical protein ACKOSS_08420 [Planctomycetia bacterium]